LSRGTRPTRIIKNHDASRRRPGHLHLISRIGPAIACLIDSSLRIFEEGEVGHSDDILAAISKIHAAGLDADRWPDALSQVTKLIGGRGASLEFMERPSLQHRGMFTYGLPDPGPYMKYYAPMCPRLPFAARQPAGALCYDALCTDDAEMDANPFFTELLAPCVISSAASLPHRRRSS
jgi:hypothetical protein